MSITPEMAEASLITHTMSAAAATAATAAQPLSVQGELARQHPDRIVEQLEMNTFQNKRPGYR